MKDELAKTDPWQHLSQWTSARIAMGRVGSSQPTKAVLDFTMDHATARDTIHTALDVGRLERKLHAADFSSLRAWSKACNRSEYLRRPDRGRTLNPACIEALKSGSTPSTHLLTVVIADGLSSLAPASHALPLLRHLRDGLVGWALDCVVVATQARVALGDEIGQIRGSEAVLVLIGERPGLKSPDSLGAYLTYHPRIGCTDAERNCVSNIRPEGLSYQNAVFKILHLLKGARLQGGTGISLKDSSDLFGLEPGARKGRLNG